MEKEHKSNGREITEWIDDTEKINKWLNGRFNAVEGERPTRAQLASGWLEIKKALPEFKRKLIENAFHFVPYKK